MDTASIYRELENRNDRSAWDKGVTIYAFDLLDSISEALEYDGEELSLSNLKAYALNGASNWTQYSYGGCSLICDCDIAERLCTPSELKRKRGGELQPNSHETWLDVQARALFQAYNRLRKCMYKVA